MAPRQRNIHHIDQQQRRPFITEDISSTSLDDAVSTSDSSTSSQEEKEAKSIKTSAKFATISQHTTNTMLNTISESDRARDNHDYFNLVALPFIVISGVMNHDFPSAAYNGNYFWLMWATTLIYFFLDLAWVVKVPSCVKSPGVIVKHHIVAMFYLCAPIAYPDYRWMMSAILSVELNTWFLICRRIVYRSHYSRCYAPINPIITNLVSALFYVTWILIRCFLYPYVLVVFGYMYRDAVVETGHYFFRETIFIFVHVALCILNLKWTKDLFTPIIKRWFGSGPKSLVVQNGL